jgi:lysine 2,3-aminomutase
MNDLLKEEIEPPLAQGLPSSELVLETATSNAQLFKNTEIIPSDFTVANPSALNFRAKFFPKATDVEWNNWKWQIQNSYTNFAELSEILDISDVDEETIAESNKLPLRITPYYASLFDEKPKNYPLIKSVVPSKLEFITTEGEEEDPLHEEEMCPTESLVHRYPDRVLMLSTGFCSVYCRYCTRSRMATKDQKSYGLKAWKKSIEYIKNNPSIRDIVISGGDPLTMPDKQIDFLLSSLRSIPHLEIIRIGTKVPTVLPQRITNNLVNIIKKYHPIYMSVHITHPDEFTPEVKEACNRLANAGIVMGSQTVLLKGINDDVTLMKDLMHKALMNRIKPYYIYQCDPIPGSSHFRTPISKGLEIIQGLRGFTSGYAIPHFVVDAPGGGGKIPLLPEYYQGREGNYVVMKNFEGKTYKYYDPE